MAARTAIHTVPRSAKWVVVREGSDRALGTYATKAEAEAAGRERARRDKTEHIIHKKDGTIGKRSSYGHDPRSRPG